MIYEYVDKISTQDINTLSVDFFFAPDVKIAEAKVIIETLVEAILEAQTNTVQLKGYNLDMWAMSQYTKVEE